MKLGVSELFYSLQGEGANAGKPMIFIRLQGCKAKGACYAAGIRCDTEFESGREYDLPELLERIKKFSGYCQAILWTGGEPMDQLTPEVVAYFRENGYDWHGVESSGLHPIPDGIFDHITVSPKVSEFVLKKNFGDEQIIHELRYVRHAGQEIPRPPINAEYLYLSPHSDGFTINQENLQHCMQLCLDNPEWSLSVQQHKIWSVL